MSSTKTNNKKVYKKVEEIVYDIEGNSYPDDVTTAKEYAQELEKNIHEWVKTNAAYFTAHKETRTALKDHLKGIRAGYKELARAQKAHQKTAEYKKALEERPDDEFLTPEEAEFGQQVNIITGELKNFMENLKKTMSAIEEHERGNQKGRQASDRG